ncbi:MAG: hypothetical protein BZY88_15085 [SAR202 cluster bacterium Io17-Chloro-G9]|nr:MAG: hypothetical protein BZY88_15085 [SAR202 cluster bacterium Io17-Chloro-G9]
MIGVIAKIFRRREVDCIEVRRRSSDYIEEQLPRKKFTEVQDHLKGCAPCRAFVDTLASTIGLITRLPRVATPARFKQSILERVREEQIRREG